MQLPKKRQKNQIIYLIGNNNQNFNYFNILLKTSRFRQYKDEKNKI